MSLPPFLPTSVMVGIPGRDGSNVLPTDEAISQAIDDSGSATAASLTAAYVSVTDTASETAQGIVELATNAEAVTGTDAARAVTPAGVAAAIAALVDASPATLNTLNELAAALGDDPNFATTMTTALATKITSDDVDILEVSATPPATPASGTLWLPSTDWLEDHEHPQYADHPWVKSLASQYFHLWGDCAATTSNLGAFSGALHQRPNMALFYWGEASTSFQNWSCEVTTLGTGVLRLGLYAYDYEEGVPGALEYDLGTADVTTTGVKTVTTAFTLSRGWHWLFWSWQGTNTTGPVIRARVSVGNPQPMALSSLALSTQHTPAFYASTSTITGALPADLGTPPNPNMNPQALQPPSIAFQRVA